jgi:CheY-like chemotaxis protein
MPGRPRFLLVDDNPDGRFLLAKTLLRKYPNALLHECQDIEAAVDAVRTLLPHSHNSYVIAHRASNGDGRTLISALRREHPSIPIIWISGQDRTEELALAGATRFLHYDAWLMIGSTVEEISA